MDQTSNTPDTFSFIPHPEEEPRKAQHSLSQPTSPVRPAPVNPTRDSPKLPKADDNEAWTHSQEDTDPHAFSDSFVEGPFRFYIRSVDSEVRVWDEEFPLRAGRVLGLDVLAEKELAEEEEFDSNEAELENRVFVAKEGQERIEEINRRVREKIKAQEFRGESDRFQFSYHNWKGEQITAALTRSQIFDILIEQRFDDVLEQGLVKYDALRSNIPAFDPTNPTRSKRNLLLKAKVVIYDRVFSLSRYGISDAQFRPQAR